MKKLLLGTAAIVAIVAAQPARAADIPPAPVYKAPIAAPAVYSWTGFYLGLGVGLRSSRTDAITTSETIGSVPLDLTGRVTSLPFDGTTFRASPYFGYNWQVAPQWVVGVEGD